MFHIITGCVDAATCKCLGQSSPRRGQQKHRTGRFVLSRERLADSASEFGEPRKYYDVLGLELRVLCHYLGIGTTSAGQRRRSLQLDDNDSNQRAIDE